MHTDSFFEHLDDEVVQRALTRRNALMKAGKWTLGAALASSVPVAFGLSARSAFGQSLPQQVVDVLNYALTLEYLEDEFYRRGLQASGLIPAAARPTFQLISDHEAAHVALLKSVLGSRAVAKPTFDFTGGNGAGNGPFNPFSDYNIFLALSQGFEDTGVRAYKGQAAKLKDTPDVLTTALQIHSIEARHASQVRRMRGKKGWIVSNNTDVAALQAVYAGEQNTTHAGVNLATALSGFSTEAITEAFDEPLTMAEVLAIADPFIAG